MYYNKFVGRWVLDALDYFLISSFITSSLTSYLKNYLSERARMKRLKNDIIKKSRLIEVIDSVNPQVVVIACCTGGATGFICSWFSVGALFVAPPTLVSFFLLRSLGQQIKHNAEYTKLKNSIFRLLKDKNFQEDIKTILFDNQKIIDNSKKIKLEYLNWNKNPAIKEAAERLGIFENAPSSTGPLNLDILDPDSKTVKFLEEFGIFETPNPKTPIRRGKTVNFRDFVDGMINGESDLDVIDAEIVQEPVRIRVKD